MDSHRVYYKTVNYLNPLRTIACFVTSHGFGHAARASAVLSAMRQRIPGLQIELFTETPAWFFAQSLGNTFSYHPTFNDVGVVQPTPLDENLPATIEKLAQLLPISALRAQEVAHQLVQTNCQLVLSDISPLGITAAKAAAIPVVLQENFRWDWIYAGYLEKEPRFAPYINILNDIYNTADIHIQAEPLCDKSPTANLHANPIARASSQSRNDTRTALQISQAKPAILITMGGIPPQFNFLAKLKKFSNISFILPGARNQYIQEDNLVIFPHHSTYYHPDLVNAVDAVIGKAGYSTIAEAYHNGIPFAFISRSQFREAPALTRFINENMVGFEIPDTQFEKYTWIDRIPELIDFPRIHRSTPNGAEQVADFILQFFHQ